jgi:hypothetical protein
MNAVVSIEHPAWAHQFRGIISELERRGHNVLVLAIDKDNSYALLDAFNVAYERIAPTTGANIFQKGWLFFLTAWRMFWACRRFRPEVFFGRASPMMAVNSFLFRKPHILYEDSEFSRFSLAVCRLFSTTILTPRRFRRDLGPKQRSVDTFKELFYLHPSVFTPDPSVVERLGLAQGGYVFVRFIAWNASHEFGMRELSAAGQLRLVRALESMMPVVVSYEGAAPAGLRPYIRQFPLADVHHLLAHAALYVGEGITMASEAAVLGTHAVCINPQSAGTLEDQEGFGLLTLCPGQDRYERGLELARELLADPQLTAKGAAKRQAMLARCVEINQEFVALVERAAAGISATRPA